jgi:hypothetical protein
MVGNLEYQEKKHFIKGLVHIDMSAIRTRNLCVDKHYKLIRIQYIPDIVRCVDIGGIDDHHCLNFLFIETTFITKQI